MGIKMSRHELVDNLAKIGCCTLHPNGLLIQEVVDYIKCCSEAFNLLEEEEKTMLFLITEKAMEVVRAQIPKS